MKWTTLQTLNILKKKQFLFLFLIIFLFQIQLSFSNEKSYTLYSQPQNTISSKYFIIHYSDGYEKYAPSLLELAENSREMFHEYVLLPLNHTTDIYLYKDKNEFIHFAENNPEHVAACAIASKNLILVNDASFRNLPEREKTTIFLHEYTHLYLGKMLKREIPRWLNEGIAMHCASQNSLADTAKISSAILFGKTIPLKDIMLYFPSDEYGFRLAYAESFSIVDFIISVNYRYKGIGGLIDDLANKDHGEVRIDQYWDTFFLKGIEVNWLKKNSGFQNWLIFAGSSTIFWFLMSMLFIMAYIIKKVQQRQKMKEWEAEDMVYASLDEEENDDEDSEEYEVNEDDDDEENK